MSTPRPSSVASFSPRTRARMARRKDMAARRSVMMPSLERFYEKEKRFKVLCRHVVAEGDAISCRVLEHLCTRYIVTLDGPALYRYKGRVVNLNEEYKRALDSNSKALFDCFRRGPKIEFTKHGRTITTTVGQLYWFKWAIENGVLNYAYRIREELERHAAAEKRERTAEKRRTVASSKKRAHPGVPALDLPPVKRKRRPRRKAEPSAFTMGDVRINVDFA